MVVLAVTPAACPPAPCLREVVEPVKAVETQQHQEFYGTAAQMGSHGTQGTLVSPSTGIALRTYQWPAIATAKGVVIALHGHGSYACYEFLKSVGVGKPPVYRGSWVEALNAQGYTVVSLDLQSHGASEGLHGLRCYFSSFDHLVEDVAALATELRSTAPYHTTSFFLMGESMGGGLATVTALRHASMFSGCVLLAPMLSLEKVSSKGINPYLRPFGALLSQVVPTAQIVHTEKSPLQDEVQQTFEQDPVTYTQPTRVRVANEYIRITEHIRKQMPNVDTPLFIVHSELDTMCDADGSKQLYMQAKTHDKTLRLVNTMWHALVKEFGNEEVLQDIIAWLDARVGAVPAA